MSGPATYSGNGTSFTQPNAPPGNYTITYGAVPGYATPPSETRTLAVGGTITFTGSYLPLLPQLTVAPGSLSFNYFTSTIGPIASQQINVSSSGSPVLFSTSVSAGASNWLFIQPSSGTTPRGLQISVSPNLQPGVYNGSILISSSQTSNPQLSVPVTLTVSRPQLLVSPSSLQFSSEAGPRSLAISSNDGSPIRFAANPSPGAISWLAVEPGDATTPTNLQVSMRPNSLAAGVYTTSILVSSPDAANSVSVPVTLTVSATTGPIPYNSLGAPGGPSNPAGSSAEPINTATGNYYTSHTDLALPGKGLGFAFTRFYNSADPYSGPLGKGWTHSLNVTLSESANTITIKEVDGQGVTFTGSAGGVYTPQTKGIFDRLQKNSDGTFTLTRKNQTRLNFSSFGRLLSIADRNGNTQTLSYDGTGRLSSVVDSSGRTIAFNYDASNRIIFITTPLNRTLQYSYDGSGNLISFRDALGGITGYTYDSAGRMLTATDPRGNVYLQNTYDSQGRVISQRNARGHVTTLAYNTPNTGTTTITDPLGNITKHVHDGDLRLVQVINADGGITSNTYDANNLKTKVTDPLGRATSYTFDAAGNTTGVTDAAGKTATFAFDATNNLTRITDRLARVISLAYDTKGNLLTVTDAAGGVTTMTYDTAGQMLTLRNARGITTTFSYDAAGNRIKITDGRGGVIDRTFDAAGRMLTIKDQTGGIWTYTYDLNDRLLSLKDPLGNTATRAYDPNGNLTRETDANGRATQYTYDSTDKISQVTNAAGGITRYTYDANTDLSSITDAKGNVTTFVFDNMRRLKSVRDPLQKTVVTNNYDLTGNITSQVDGNGKTNRFGYDALNRRTSVTLWDGKNVSFTLDAEGNRLTMVDARGTTAYAVDALNRITSVTTPDGKVVKNEYDSVGNRTKITYPDGKVAQQAFDALNQLASVTAWNNQVISYTRDAAGRVTIASTPANNAVVDYGYDSAGRLTGVTNKLGGVVTSSFAYTLDSVGNRTTMKLANGSEHQYGYDALYRLTSWTPPGSQPIQYAYDAMSNRTTLTAPDAKVSYTYDTADQLTSLTTTQCAWSATSPTATSWVSIPAGGTGTDAGAVSYAIAANTGADPRTTSLTVAGQVFHVLQKGTSTAQPYTDVPASHLFADHITLIKRRDLAPICTADTYCPDRATTRAEMAVFIIRGLYGDNFTFTATPHFTDVPTTHQFFKYIQKMKDLGITSGCTATTYCPSESVTRGQIAVFIVRAKLGDNFAYRTAPYFGDTPGTNIFFRYIQKLKELGITTGCTATEYCPNDQNTRGQIAVFVARAFLTPWTEGSQGNPNCRLSLALPGASVPAAGGALSLNVANASTTTLTYDGNGNQLTKTVAGLKTDYGWNALGLLASMMGGGYETQYGYDGDGNRVSQTAGGTYQYVNDTVSPLPVVLSEDGPNGSINNLWGEGLISAHGGGLDTHHQFDGLGSVVSVSNPNIVLTRYSADPWGVPAAPALAGDRNRFGFTGEPMDSNGLLYLRARYYDAATGRFISRDPIRSSTTLYGYARENPTTLVDPSGLTPGAIIGVVAGGISGYIAGSSNGRGIQGGLKGLFIGAIVGGVVGFAAPWASSQVGGGVAGALAFSGVNAFGSGAGTVLTNLWNGEDPTHQLGSALAIGFVAPFATMEAPLVGSGMVAAASGDATALGWHSSILGVMGALNEARRDTKCPR
ncbi:MAG: S-layer homology domain-containing protein [Fimbriimonadaceae bacterium]|nr:S-layer homology domain-containing protein [Fimbriimonadaceae bacterium]